MVEVGPSGIRADMRHTLPRQRRVRDGGKLALGLLLAILVIVVDQITKNWALRQFPPGNSIEQPVTSFFSFVLVGNRGVSFGMFNGEGTGNAILFTVIALIICVGLGFWLTRTWRTLLAVGIGLVIGGAIGNVVDRIRLGSVVDFLDFHAGTYHWPSFNLADAAICIGVLFMLVDGFRERPSERPLESSEGELTRGELVSEENVVLMGAELPKTDHKLRGGRYVSPDTPETGLLLKPGRPMRDDVLVPPAAPPLGAPSLAFQPAPGMAPQEAARLGGQQGLEQPHGHKHLTPRSAGSTNTGGPHGA